MPKVLPKIKILESHELPCAHKHTKQPIRYSEWHSWAERKSKTHKQVRCEDCGRLAIWVSKTKD